VILYTALAMSLAVLSCVGVPWTPQCLGILVFLSAFPFLWLNERREARMMQLFQTALRKASVVESSSVDPRNEGKLLLTSGPLAAGEGERLESPRWGVEAPPRSAALRVQVEAYQPVGKWSWRRFLCDSGEWYDGGADVSSEERRAVGAHVGAFRLDSMQLGDLDAWEPFPPKQSERLIEVTQGELNRGFTAPIMLEDARCCGCCSSKAHAPEHHVARSFGLTVALPFPGMKPCVEEGGTVLYYPFGGGRLGAPRLNDVRVLFLHLPCSDRQPFTAVGVQRGSTLDSFRFKAPPPQGLSLGITGDRDFNIGDMEGDHYAAGSWQLLDKQDGKGDYMAVDTRSADAAFAAYGRNIGPGDAETARQAVRGQMAVQGQVAKDLPWWVPFGLRALVAGFMGAAEGWRHVLHRHVPEVLPCLAPGERSRCSFFCRAHGREILLTWRLRVLGFMLMAAGAEIALWKWEAELALLGGVFAQALWAAVLVGAGGFTATTAALAMIFYRPITATLYLGSAVALFAALFGWLTLLVALSFVASCMLLVVALLACHLALPC